MPAFQLAVARCRPGRMPGIVRTGPNVRHVVLPDKRLEVPGDELRTIVADDPRCDAFALLQRSLTDDLHVQLRHRLA